MPMRLTSVVFEADNVEVLAGFWEGELDGWSDESWGDDEWQVVSDDPEISTVNLVFVAGPPPPKAGKNRIHLDLNTANELQYQQLVEDYIKYGDRSGIRQVDIGQGELVPWTVFADLEDNEFCVLKARDRYARSGDIAAIVVDSADPGRLASFYSAVTGLPVVDNEPEFAALRALGGDHSPFLEFSRVADREPEQGRVSLGFESYWAHQHDADIERLLELDARKVRTHEGEVSYTVLADPEGNEFRIVIPVWPPAADRV